MPKNQYPSLWKVLMIGSFLFVLANIIASYLDAALEGFDLPEMTDDLSVVIILIFLGSSVIYSFLKNLKFKTLKKEDVVGLQINLGGMFSGQPGNPEHIELVEEWCQRHYTLQDVLSQLGEKEPTLEFDLNGGRYSLIIHGVTFFDSAHEEIARVGFGMTMPPQLKSDLESMKHMHLSWNCTHINRA